MSAAEVIEVEMPDGTIALAEVLMADTVTDARTAGRLRLGAADETVRAFVGWAVNAIVTAPPLVLPMRELWSHNRSLQSRHPV